MHAATIKRHPTVERAVDAQARVYIAYPHAADLHSRRPSRVKLERCRGRGLGVVRVAAKPAMVENPPAPAPRLVSTHEVAISNACNQKSRLVEFWVFDRRLARPSPRPTSRQAARASCGELTAEAQARVSCGDVGRSGHGHRDRDVSLSRQQEEAHEQRAARLPCKYKARDARRVLWRDWHARTRVIHAGVNVWHVELELEKTGQKSGKLGLQVQLCAAPIRASREGAGAGRARHQLSR